MSRLCHVLATEKRPIYWEKSQAFRSQPPKRHALVTPVSRRPSRARAEKLLYIYQGGDLTITPLIGLCLYPREVSP